MLTVDDAIRACIFGAAFIAAIGAVTGSIYGLALQTLAPLLNSF